MDAPQDIFPPKRAATQGVKDFRSSIAFQGVSRICRIAIPSSSGLHCNPRLCLQGRVVRLCSRALSTPECRNSKPKSWPRPSFGLETTLVTKQDLKDREATIISKINDKIDSKIEKLDGRIERAIVVIISIVAAIATLTTTIIIAFLS